MIDKLPSSSALTWRTEPQIVCGASSTASLATLGGHHLNFEKRLPMKVEAVKFLTYLNADRRTT